MKNNNTTITKNIISENIANYKNEDISIYLKLVEKPNGQNVLWNKSLRCHLQLQNYRTSQNPESSDNYITSLKIPALLLKKIGLLEYHNLMDNNGNIVSTETFYAPDIEAALNSPNTDSINQIYQESFQELFPQSEGWISKKIVPHINTLYDLIYKSIDKGSATYDHYKNILTRIKLNRIERSNGQQKSMDDTSSSVGTIIAILILLKRYHLQYIDTKKSNPSPPKPLKECSYSANDAKLCKISLTKILNAYLNKSRNHTNLGSQFQSILLFNSTLTVIQEFSTILLLARVESSFITPLDIVKNFVFYNYDAWLLMPDSGLTTKHPGMNFAQLAFTKHWRWSAYSFWKRSPTIEKQYVPGDWSELMETPYKEQLSILMNPNDSYNDDTLKFIEQRFHKLTDYLTLLSIYPYEYGLELTPDVIKTFHKKDTSHPFWSLINRFPTAIEKLEMERYYNGEVHFINNIKQLQPLIDSMLLFFNQSLQEIIDSNYFKTLSINYSDLSCNNTRNLARYITDTENKKAIKDFINWLSSHKHHIHYYITSIINESLDFAPNPNNDISVRRKKAYLTALKVLYRIYKISSRKFVPQTKPSRSNATLKSLLFPPLNSYNQNNTTMQILKNILFKSVIITIIFNLNPKCYFYNSLQSKLNGYQKFVTYLYKLSLLNIDNNLFKNH